MKSFAKLETIGDNQILVELQSGPDGPCVRIRRDNSVTVEMTQGPWPDNSEGWDEAEKVFNEADLAAYAKELDAMANSFTEN